MMIVHRLNDSPISWPPMLIAELSAMPVTMPGNASGRIRKKETVSRPKKRKRCTANAARLPSARARVVAPSPAFNEVIRAPRTSMLFQVATSQRVENPGSGHACERSGLKAYRKMIRIGR